MATVLSTSTLKESKVGRGNFPAAFFSYSFELHACSYVCLYVCTYIAICMPCHMYVPTYIYVCMNIKFNVSQSCVNYRSTHMYIIAFVEHLQLTSYLPLRYVL